MGEHYFTADPSVPFERTRIEVEAWGHRLELDTGSGVFSHGRLDSGTAVLLRAAEEWGPPRSGRVLDLGCGYGPLGLAVAAANPECVVRGVDVNERAVALANGNAGRLGLGDRFHAVLPGQVPAQERYDEIWSNPPIRIGKDALHALLLTWLPRLEAGGRAVLVVGKNLGVDSLSTWLSSRGHPTVRLASSKGFRVLQTAARVAGPT